MIKLKDSGRESGFTLMEVIVSLIIIAIMGSMMVTYMATNVQKAGDRALFTQTVCNSSTKAEEVLLNYLELFQSDVRGLEKFKAKIDTGSYSGNGNTVTSDWVTLDTSTNSITTTGATSDDEMLRVTVTPSSGDSIRFLVTQAML